MSDWKGIVFPEGMRDREDLHAYEIDEAVQLIDSYRAEVARLDFLWDRAS